MTTADAPAIALFRAGIQEAIRDMNHDQLRNLVVGGYLAIREDMQAKEEK